MNRRPESGFSVVEVLLVLVVIGLIGFVGWFVYSSQQKTNNTHDAVIRSSQNTDVVDTEAARTEQSDLIVETMYSKAPAELQTAILDYSKSDMPGCVKNNQIVDSDGQPSDRSVRYVANKYAAVPLGCDGGAEFLFAYTNGIWKEVDGTQFGFDCDILKQYKVSVSFVKAVGTGVEGQTVNCRTSSSDVEPYLGS